MEAWLADREKYWICHFHRDPKSWVKDVMVFVDHGRAMPGNEPALLKSRRSMRYEDAVILWKQLQTLGWTVSEAVW
ncbi:DUF1651 domain-containing protein [Synechococcus sp. UW179A]|uniref:DUF1651 domain-containing protein n=1 Tax=Synechococcus sp. UW179A TaxID=2575510 RepID=UPI000E0FE6A4|nr:DUF1651 domain-containing protein [Synechococcus sp. UW179A]